ncbi:MAG TPA: glycosyltransferase WbuB, partial [Gemmatimonadetes bacterium]|nr:glycosyltransferase WbuB [Gemmatimonadota bacterium]
VEFQKPIPKAEVPRAQTEADLLLAAVTDSEAYRFGLNLNKIYDYWASARPVVFSGNAPNDPIAESGAGFSVLPEKPEALAEAINRVRLLSPLERQEMGLKGRRYVEEKFDMEVLGKKMAELLIEAAECR